MNLSVLSSSSENGYQFNQLFNYVNHVDHVELKPNETRSIILAFLPEPKGKKLSLQQQQQEEAATGTQRNAEEIFEFFEVNGLLYFYASAIGVDTTVASLEALSSKRIMKGENEDDKTPLVRSPPIYQSIANLHDSRPGTPQDATAAMTEYPSVASGVVSPTYDTVAARSHAVETPSIIKFRSKVCQSVLWCNIADSGISFEECVIGGMYFKDFTVWNRSEIDLYFSITLPDIPQGSWFKVTDYDTGDGIDLKPIPSFSYRRIRLTFSPSEECEISADIQLENFNDSNNVESIHIQAFVRAMQQEESLVITSGNVLDFGDCYAGVWTKQQLSIKSKQFIYTFHIHRVVDVSDAPIEISFSSETSNVVFDLKQDDMENRSDNDLPYRKEERDESAPPSVASSRGTSPSRPLSRDSRSASSLDFADELNFRRTDSRNSLLRNEVDMDFDKATSRGRINNEIEELVLRPGMEKSVEVSFRPEKTQNNGSFDKVAFRIQLNYCVLGDSKMEKKKIKCNARACTSLIDISPKELNFGDVDVGTLKSLPLRITNLSDLMATVELRFNSKVLNCYRGEISIPPRQHQEVKIDIYPRKVYVLVLLC